jgi:hypothetical protein
MTLRESLSDYIDRMMGRPPYGRNKTGLAKRCKELGFCGESTFKLMARGEDVEAKVLQDFADALRLNPIDRSELYIRAGEAGLDHYSYLYPAENLAKFLREFEVFQTQTVREISLKAHVPSSVTPEQDLRTGFKKFREALGLTQDFIEVERDRSTISHFENTGFIHAHTLKLALDKFAPVLKRLAATDLSRYENLLLTQQKICAHFIEMKYGRILDFTARDFDAFQPEVHTRLMHWLLSSDFKLLNNKHEPIKAIYFKPGIDEDRFSGGIGHKG